MGLKDWVSKKIDGVKESAQEARNLVKLQEHFKTLSDTRTYLKRHRDELKDVGVTDYFRNPKSVELKIRLADEEVKKALGAASAIGKTPLRFSSSYLSDDIGEIDGLIDDFTGISTDLLESVSDPDGWIGSAASLVMSDDTKRQVKQLGATVKRFGTNANLLKKSLGQLEDPNLKTPCNNSLLSPYLGVTKKIQGAQEDYDRLKEVYDKIETVRKLFR
jgi:hypothetical protein